MAIEDKLTYPAARRVEQVDEYFGTAVADPYRWMEDLDSPELKEWVDAENALTQEFLTGDAERAAARNRIHARLMELTNYERFGMPEREAGRLFFMRNSGLQNQSVLYWQDGEDGEAKVLIDPNALSEDATVALGSYSVSEDGTLIAYSLSEAGSDIQRIQVRRVATGEDLADVVSWVKFSGISWAKDGNGFYYSSYGAPSEEVAAAEALKQVSHGHKLYFHRLGSPQSEDAVIFERPDDVEMLVGGGVSEDGRYLVLSSGKGHTNALAIRDLAQPEAELIQLAPVDDAIYGFIGNVGERVWLQINKDAPNSKIVEVDLNQPQRESWKTVVAEAKESLESAAMVGETLLLSYLVDAKSKVEQRALDGTSIREVMLPDIGATGMGGGRREDKDVFFVFTNYTTPGTVYRLDLESGTSSVWKQPKLQFDPAAYETTQIFCTSKDGTKVPLFITSKRGLKRDGSAPAILYGYGGFSVSLGPAYSSSRLAWLEMGGIYAEAILRGGGEYGESWHEAGTKTNKQNVFDDFIACAERLIADRYTSAERLAINGGSNGGLLVAAVSLQRPELFGAVLAQVGVLDMLRFDKFTIGYAWKPDYGSPSENEAEFRAILQYSPLQNVRPGKRYPATMITTGDHDDRVFPAHSFKYAAALQEASAETDGARPMLIRVETRAGHGGGMPLSKQLDVTADMYGFLEQVLSREGRDEDR